METAENQVEVHPELVSDALAIVPDGLKSDVTAMRAFLEEEAAKAKALEVVDDLTFAQAGDRLRAIKGAAKKLEAVRAEMKRPILDAGRKIDAFFKAPAGQLADAEGVLKRRIAAYQAEVERKRREAEEAARRERERLERERREAEEAARLAAEAAPMDEAPEPPFGAPEAPEPTVVVPEPARLQGISTRTVVKARVVSIVEVVRAAAAGHPDAFQLISIDQSALNALVRAKGAALAVPGVETFEETVVSARSA